MIALDDFIVDDEKIDCPAWSGSDSRRAAMPQPDRDRLLGVLLHELETAGTLVACVASAMSFVVRFPHRSRALCVMLPAWMPASPLGPGTRAGPQPASCLDLEAVKLLHDVTVHLEIARASTRRHCEAIGRGEPVAPVVTEHISSLWSVLCERMLALLQAIGPLVPQPPTGEKPASAERLLAAAALGGSPCVSADGNIEIPGWIERRSDRRHRLRLPCTLHLDDRQLAVETNDISLSGAGLDGLPEVPVGTRATLVVAGRAHLQGAIVWRKGARGGFLFDRQLLSLTSIARLIEGGA